MLNKKIIAILLALAGSAAAQDSVEVPIDQAAPIAVQALRGGDPALALQIAEAVLAQLPDDRTALIVVAAAAPQLGDAAKGRRAGARAWAVSQNDVQKYEAARLTALAAANEERFTLATFWLRRALTVAPNEEERARTIRNARIVKQRNPLAIQLSFSLVPSNNVNGGADEELADATQGLSFSDDSFALEGWRASLNVGLQYRFQESQRSRTTAGFAYQVGRVRITENADVPDEAYDTAFYDFSLRHDRALENGTLTVRASRGLYEYRQLRGGEVNYQDYKLSRFSIDRNFPINDSLLLSLSAGRDWLAYLNDNIGDVNRTTLRTGLTYQRENQDRVGLSFSITDAEGKDNANYNSNQRAIDLSYTWAEPVTKTWFDVDFPVTLSLGAGYRWTEYPDYFVFLVSQSVGRDDTTVSANATIGLPSVEYAGFSPSIRIDASQSASNLDRFDSSTFSVGLNFNSSF